MAVKVNDRYLRGFVRDHELAFAAEAAETAHNLLIGNKGAGNDFTGWVNLPDIYDKDEFARIKKAADKIKSDSEILIVIGIGGSYLGAKAIIDALASPLYNSLDKKTPDIYFAGNSISPTYLSQIVSLVKDKDFSVNVISKSGTTTEPALAFRVFRKLLQEKYGDKANERIYATTDKSRGTLKSLADKNGWDSFVIADDVGGRFSVLTAVGLLPVAVAGLDIDALMKGAADALAEYKNPDALSNECVKYAILRNVLYRKGFKCEMLVAYENSFTMMNEWYKQLFGESEGKDGKGLFPVSGTFSTDLHSLGQFVQDGSKILFETAVVFDKPQTDFFLDDDPDNADGLNFLSGQNMSVVNRKAFEGTIIAHTEGGTPNIVLEVPTLDEYNLGYLIYFFERACAVSGYMLGVNPFDQPGVESYKKNMFALLGKPGYEDIKAELEKKIGG
ncbi:MAG: glucose-6-phosphate isomerase [Oscillospiraceae bacterium]|nr:glucose-6-phosphate isomerase [Oscillospiraceae bacterium]